MHHTAKLIWHFMLRTGILTNMVDSCSQASNQCLKKVCVSESLWCWTSQKIYNLRSMKTWRRNGGAVGSELRWWREEFPVGSPFRIHLNCSGKERFRRLLWLPSKRALAHCRWEEEYCFTKACFDHGSRLGHALGGIRNFLEVWAQAAFSG